MGAFSAASGFCSTATGGFTVASGFSSFAIGEFTEASALDTIAMGAGTAAVANFSAALGVGTNATGVGETVVGICNELEDDTVLFRVGNGAYQPGFKFYPGAGYGFAGKCIEGKRSDALRVTRDGRCVIQRNIHAHIFDTHSPTNNFLGQQTCSQCSRREHRRLRRRCRDEEDPRYAGGADRDPAEAHPCPGQAPAPPPLNCTSTKYA